MKHKARQWCLSHPREAHLTAARDSSMAAVGFLIELVATYHEGILAWQVAFLSIVQVPNVTRRVHTMAWRHQTIKQIDIRDLLLTTPRGAPSHRVLMQRFISPPLVLVHL